MIRALLPSLRTSLRRRPACHPPLRALRSSLYLSTVSMLSTDTHTLHNLRRHSTSSGMAGYEAFGSFHTPATSALFAQQEQEVDVDAVARELNFQRLDLSESAAVSSRNREQFALDLDKWTYLNHGAFGAPTRIAVDAASKWRAQADAQPLNFHDRELFPLVVKAIKGLASFVGVRRPEQLVLLPNATSGLDAVLSSVVDAVEEGEEPTVVLFSTRYGAARKMLQSLQSGGKTRKLHVHEEPLSLEASYDDDEVLRRLEAALDAMQTSGRRVALVVVDHITSNTAVKMPVKEIVQRCHSREDAVPVLVDGAHGLLNLHLDLDDLGADYYVGNCHKWFCSARGAAFLHVARENGPWIRPRVVSHGFFDGMQSAFMWTGLQDYSPWLALPECMAFWRFQGVDETRKYLHNLAQSAAELLYSRWGMPDHLERERRFPRHKRHAMRLVQLPMSRRLCGGVLVDKDDPKATSTDAKRVQDALHFVHHIEAPVKCVGGQLYVRISAHVYNCLGDFEKLAVAAVEGD